MHNIIFYAGKVKSAGVTAVLEIGKINVDDAVQKTDDFRVLIASAVIYQRKVKALPAGDAQGVNQNGKVRRRGYRFDGMAALFLKGKHDLCKGRGVKSLSANMVTDLKILTVAAAEVAG